MQTDMSVKVVVIGSVGVGKSSLVVRYVNNQFNEHLQSTLGAVYLEKIVVHNSQKIKFQFWDTAGQERYKAIARIYYKDCKVALVVYDTTARDTFEQLKKWMQELKTNAPEDVLKIIVGNKTDLEAKDEISYQQLIAYANSEGALFKYTSAKDGKGVDDLFTSVLQAYMLKYKEGKTGGKQKLKRSMGKKKSCC